MSLKASKLCPGRPPGRPPGRGPLLLPVSLPASPAPKTPESQQQIQYACTAISFLTCPSKLSLCRSTARDKSSTMLLGIAAAAAAAAAAAVFRQPAEASWNGSRLSWYLVQAGSRLAGHSPHGGLQRILNRHPDSCCQCDPHPRTPLPSSAGGASGRCRAGGKPSLGLWGRCAGCGLPLAAPLQIVTAQAK